MGWKQEDAARFEELLVEMTYAWSDIENELDEDIFGPLLGHLSKAFRVEACEDANDFGDPYTVYAILFDAEDHDARTGARKAREQEHLLDQCRASSFFGTRLVPGDLLA